MKLNKHNYYSQEANLHYMSVSQFKSFLPTYRGCEARAMAELTEGYQRPSTPAFIEGHYVHAWNEGTLDEFKANNPDLYSSRGPTKGQLKINFQHCNKMIEVLENDHLVMKALAGQKEVIMTAELFGIPWKVMIDSYQPELGIFADLKALSEIGGRWWNNDLQCYENFLDYYGYLVQMAVYAEVERLANGRKLKKWLLPHMVIVTKQDPPDHAVIYFDYDAIETHLAIVAKHIERVKSVKSGEVEPTRCEKCEYCRETKKISSAIHYLDLIA
ncbi:PD-(D/E)XK nuclease-like domain-containing protein [Brevibacillus brevis]|uniref:PD-(D/E)XK nuclease-like domain-containing protein n=1 Tax=Brevibacillus brevis TaxID=1393 RepID=UPI00165DE176|nr:PD-(D/E)XK nuclease-like domain-containing protein [Brevibacillus brevis]